MEKEECTIMARVNRIVVMVDDEIKQELTKMAQGMGLTTSALCAYVLGQFIYQQKTFVFPMLKEVGDVAVRTVERAASEVQALGDESRPAERSEAAGGKP